MNRKGIIERRLRRLSGMSPEKLAEIRAAQGSQLWWVRCWNCHRNVEMRRVELESAPCPHCGVSLWSRHAYTGVKDEPTG